jgi:hypothetical protein
MAKLEKIKRIARDVYRALGLGFDEKVYDKAMQVGLRLASVKDGKTRLEVREVRC